MIKKIKAWFSGLPEGVQYFLLGSICVPLLPVITPVSLLVIMGYLVKSTFGDYFK